MKNTQFTEHINEIRGRVDAKAGVIRGVKILGPRSRNGRQYSMRAMEQAAALYEGVRVNLDHPGRNEPSSGRSLADRLGVLRNVRVERNGVYGDLFLLTSHPLAAMVIEAAEKMPGTLGLSHNAEGHISTENGRAMVETIASVHSVDLVQNPATVAGLFENTAETADTTGSSTGGDTSGDGTTRGAHTGEAGGAVPELKRRIAELEAQLQEQRSDAAMTQHCHSLLVANQCPPTLQRIDMLKHCAGDDQRRQLIESWQPVTAPRPAESPGVRHLSQSYAERTRHGIAAALGR